MLRRRFLFAKVYEEKPVYKYTYTTTNGLMLSNLAGAKNHKYKNGVGSFETLSKKCVSFEEQDTLESIVIPEGITSIGGYAFKDCYGLTNIEIPNSVTSIEEYAFSGCTGLTSITIPSSLVKVEHGVFRYCDGLKEVHINNLTAWCNIDFAGSESNPLYYARNLYLNNELITELVIPNGVKRIKKHAFYNCTGLTSVTIPNSVTSIRERAFWDCTELTNVVIGNSVTNIGADAFYYCTLLKTVYNYSNLTFTKGSTNHGHIAYYAYVVINAGSGSHVDEDGDFIWVVSDNSNVLALCRNKDLEEVNLQSDYNGQEYEIGEGAFVNCTKLAKITIPNKVTNIGNDAFDRNSIKELYIEDGDTTLNIGLCNNLGLFLKSSLETLYLGRNLNYTEAPFYSSEMLKRVTIGNKVTTIGYDIFGYCYSLTDVFISNSVTSIGEYAFVNCTSLNTINIPNSVTNIERLVFRDCTGIISATIGTGICHISEYLFYDCTNLTSVTILGDIKTIDKHAFYNCKKLENINANFSNVEEIGALAFYNTIWYNNLPDGVVYIGKTLYGYKGDMPENTTIIVNEDTLSISGYAFDKLTKLVDIVIPESVVSIGFAAFQDTGLVTVNSLGNIKTIPLALFYNCKYLENVTIPDSVTTIDLTAFYSCIRLTSITIPDSVTNIGNSAFYNCNGLTSIEIPNSVTSISTGVFASCYKLTNVVLPNSVISIGNNAFADCHKLANIKIPDSVTSIGNYAFYYCVVLTSVTIPNSVTSIGNKAFGKCNSLTEIHSLNPTPPVIAYDTFSYIKTNGVLKIPKGSDYSSWMGTSEYYLGYYNWTIEEIETV